MQGLWNTYCKFKKVYENATFETHNGKEIVKNNGYLNEFDLKLFDAALKELHSEIEKIEKINEELSRNINGI